jgi:hypothetical protein
VFRGLSSLELQHRIHADPNKAPQRVYKFWKKRLDETQEETNELMLLVHQWEQGEVGDTLRAVWEADGGDISEARKRKLIQELGHYGLAVRKKEQEGE